MDRCALSGYSLQQNDACCYQEGRIEGGDDERSEGIEHDGGSNVDQSEQETYGSRADDRPQWHGRTRFYLYSSALVISALPLAPPQG